MSHGRGSLADMNQQGRTSVAEVAGLQQLQQQQLQQQQQLHGRSSVVSDMAAQYGRTSVSELTQQHGRASVSELSQQGRVSVSDMYNQQGRISVTDSYYGGQQRSNSVMQGNGGIGGRASVQNDIMDGPIGVYGSRKNTASELYQQNNYSNINNHAGGLYGDGGEDDYGVYGEYPGGVTPLHQTRAAPRAVFEEDEPRPLSSASRPDVHQPQQSPAMHGALHFYLFYLLL
jgi:hypothetical protein